MKHVLKFIVLFYYFGMDIEYIGGDEVSAKKPNRVNLSNSIMLAQKCMLQFII